MFARVVLTRDLPINSSILTHNVKYVNAYAYINRGDEAKNTIRLDYFAVLICADWIVCFPVQHVGSAGRYGGHARHFL